MTETEWGACVTPQPMLAFLRKRGQTSARKLRLFAAVCCRRIWPLLTDERSRRTVEVLEEYAEGTATKESLSAAARDAHMVAVQQAATDNPHASAAAANA